MTHSFIILEENQDRILIKVYKGDLSEEQINIKVENGEKMSLFLLMDEVSSMLNTFNFGKILFKNNIRIFIKEEYLFIMINKQQGNLEKEEENFEVGIGGEE